MPWYEYSRLGGTNPLPMVEVILWHGTRRIRLAALIDSGADSSLLDIEFALAVGLVEADATKTTATTAGGGSMEVLSWPGVDLELQFEADRFPYKGDFARFAPGNDGISLLGRADFFDRYVLTFWESDGLVNIDASPYRARPPISTRRNKP
jgi:hypothetical protein